jgi:hypothetical protein
MDQKEDFLEAIEGFIDWFGEKWLIHDKFCQTIDRSNVNPNELANVAAREGCFPVDLSFKASQRVPYGYAKRCFGFADIQSTYQWRAEWHDPQSGTPVKSQFWDTPEPAGHFSTQDSLRLLHTRLKEAVDNDDEASTATYSLEVLRWGGVYGAVGFIEQMAEKNELTSYLSTLAPLLSRAGTSLAPLNEETILIFDSGMTKIHSILDGDGSPIYDARVGAAIAMLFEIYYADRGVQRFSSIDFPSGSARGDQVRDPSRMGFNPAPQFYTRAVPPFVWARNQLKLSWIIECILNKFPSLFAETHPSAHMADRAHAFESALFILGYDLRCFKPSIAEISRPPNVVAPVVGEMVPAINWVPTGMNLSNVASLFLKYSTERRFFNLSRLDFISWQTEECVPAVAEGSAKANSWVIGPAELDLYTRTQSAIETICGGGKMALYEAMRNRSVSSDERERVYLIDALLVGCFQANNLTPQAATDLLIERGIAGTANSASTLRTVGRNVGKFFGLLDEEGNNTELFFEFFDTPDYRDLAAELANLSISPPAATP